MIVTSLEHIIRKLKFNIRITLLSSFSLSIVSTSDIQLNNEKATLSEYLNSYI